MILPFGPYNLFSQQTIEVLAFSTRPSSPLLETEEVNKNMMHLFVTKTTYKYPTYKTFFSASFPDLTLHEISKILQLTPQTLLPRI